MSQTDSRIDHHRLSLLMETVDTSKLNQIRFMTVKDLALEVKEGRLTLVTAIGLITNWLTYRNRKEWFAMSNHKLRRHDNVETLEKALRHFGAE